MKWDTLSFFNSLIINFDMKAWKITGAIIGIILVVVLLRGCVMTSYLIPSSGMENSLFQGERILELSSLGRQSRRKGRHYRLQQSG